MTTPATAPVTYAGVEIAMKSGERVVLPGIILGPLAVTPCQAEYGGWNITHIATGLKIHVAPFSYSSPEEATRAMRGLIEIDPEWKTDEWSADKWSDVKAAVQSLRWELEAAEGSPS